jgi:hypothetical protein
MGITDLYSKRLKFECGETVDIFVYDYIPKSLRIQIIHIWNDAFGIFEDTPVGYIEPIYKHIHDGLCREYGVFELSNKSGLGSFREIVHDYFLNIQDVEKVLDVVELSFQYLIRNSDLLTSDKKNLTTNAAIEELNIRFTQNGVGYQFESGKIIRIDSTIIHKEVVKPVLNFLNFHEYKGANEEFLKAHEHYKAQRYKECLNECLKSFESVMKIICGKRKWSYDQKDTANRLIEICFANNLIPNYLQSQFTAVRSALESGIPTARNRTSGHGQGTLQANVPDYFARYILNLTATTILFLVEAEQKLP